MANQNKATTASSHEMHLILQSSDHTLVACNILCICLPPKELHSKNPLR